MTDAESGDFALSGEARRHVLLVDNFFYSRDKGAVRVELSPHLGLMSLASVLEKAGHAVEIFDPKRLFASLRFADPNPSFIEAWASEICLAQPDVVGFTAYGLSFPFVVAVAQSIRRRRPNLPILLGGPHATILSRQIVAAFDCFDAVGRFECETLIVALVEAVCCGEDLRALKGLTFRLGSEVIATSAAVDLIDMEKVPRPALHLYPIDKTLLELPLEAGRGCPYECTFCSTAVFFQRRYRVKSNKALLDEMHWASSAFGIGRFNLNHDLFGLKRSTLLGFCDLLEDHPYVWSCSMRPDQVDGELGKAMMAAGCETVYFGFETGSQRLQKEILKKLDLEGAFRNFAAFLEFGPSATVSFITGFPDETETDQAATMDMIGRLLRLDPKRVMPQLHILSPEPGTALTSGRRAIAVDGYGPENTEIPFERMVSEHPDIFSVFFHFESQLPRQQIRQASLFVQNILPEIGYGVSVHLMEKVFSGRLSKMFKAFLSGRALPGRISTEDLLADMWDEFDKVLKRNAPTYCSELVRFSRISALVRSVPDQARLNRAIEKFNASVGPGGEVVGHFDLDIVAVAEEVVRDPFTSPVASRQWEKFSSADRN